MGITPLRGESTADVSNKVYSIDELRSMVVPLLAKYGMEQASVFGSYARGEADASSDIDVLLVGRPGFSALGVFGVAEELYRVSGKHVDVYEISELNDGPFRTDVLSEAVAL